MSKSKADFIKRLILKPFMKLFCEMLYFFVIIMVLLITNFHALTYEIITYFKIIFCISLMSNLLMFVMAIMHCHRFHNVIK